MADIENIVVDVPQEQVKEKKTRTFNVENKDSKREPRQRRDRKDDKQNDGIDKKMVHVNRISKTVKGGRKMRFNSLVVAGDRKGKVGVGMGKGTEVTIAIDKATQAAKKNMIAVELKGTTIPHEVIGVFETTKVIMMPSKEGTGVIAGGPVRAVVETVGIKDIRAKALRSNNPCNVVRATMDGLKQLRNAEEVANIRGKSVKYFKD